MLAKLVYNIYFNKAYFYGVIAIDFLFVILFAFLYAGVLPWLQDGPASRFNLLQDGRVFTGPVTDYPVSKKAQSILDYPSNN